MDGNYSHTPRAYNFPNGYRRLLDEELDGDTERPEINSRNYTFKSKKTYEKAKDYLPFFCHIDCLEDLFVLGANNFNTPIFDSIVVGAPNFESIANRNIATATFRIPQDSTVTLVKLLDNDLILTALKNHQLQLSPTKATKRDGSPLFCERAVTDGFVSTASKIPGNDKIIVGTSKGHLNILNISSSTLSMEAEIRHAHADKITGLSAHPTSSKMWTTTSTDKNCLLWDKRKERPASAILKDYNNQLTTVHWTTQEENKELIMVGDETGNVLTLDLRCPNKPLKTRVSKRPINNLCFNGTKQFGVVAKTNVLSICEVDKTSEVEDIYQHTAEGMIYSMCWDTKNKNTFYVVGEQKYAEKVLLPN